MRFVRFAVPAALALVALPTLFAPRSYAQTLIDFEATPNGTYTSYTESGVTFTAVDGGSLTSTNFGPTPNGTRGIIGSASPYSEIRATISGGASFVSIDLGDFAFDADTIFLEAFNASNTSIGFTSQFIPDTFTGMTTLSLSVPNISSVVFGARPPATVGSSIYADNFRFSNSITPSAAPEPASLAVLLPAMGIAGFAIRKRVKTH
jgi:hypothetical protein